LVLIADTSISGMRIARELDRLLAERGKPGRSSVTTAPSHHHHLRRGRRLQGRLTLYRTEKTDIVA